MLDCSDYPILYRHNSKHLCVVNRDLYTRILKNPTETTQLDSLADELIDEIVRHGGAIFPCLGSPAFQYITYCRLSTRNPEIKLVFKPRLMEQPISFNLGAKL